MSKIVKYNILESLPKRDNIDMIEDNIYICEITKANHTISDHPIKTDFTICCICLQGEMDGKIDLVQHYVKAPGLAISTPEQILEPGSFSDDFFGILIYMTRSFTENFNLLLGHSLSLNVRNKPYIALNDKELKSILNYCDSVRNTIKATDNPYRLQMIIHLTIAYFYGIGYFIHQSSKDKILSKNEHITDKFLKTVRDHYKTERRVEFYAEQMQFTPNYLSHVIKDVTGKTAGEWIDDYVILESKALLKSTNMTIQQIAHELNFPSQSFFGKFFKRMVGIAPKYYR